MVHCPSWLLSLGAIVIVFSSSNACGGGGGCSAVNCRVSSWSSWGSCSRTCGSGVKTRTRTKTTYESCGGSCYYYHFKERTTCNSNCCPVNCLYSWGSWSSCSGCGMSSHSRSPTIHRYSRCNGNSCPSKQTRSCNTNKCCPVNCVVSSWSSWGSCNARCESNGQQRRSRRVTTADSCRGTPCPTLTQTKSCRGPCCRRDCQVSSWSAWGSCSAPPGRCSTNSGTRKRTRRVTLSPSCGGSSCPTLTHTSQCTPVSIPCKMNAWSSWSACSPNNGKCGAGTQYQTRTVATQPYCSPACPATRQTRSCTHSCCPRDCAVSSWGSWSACSNTCGIGTKTRTRGITVQPYCKGRACPALKNTTRCSQYNNRDCVMSSWLSWSICSNGCGSGQSTRTRRIISPAVCRGKACGARTESRPCTDYRENRDCVVYSWSSWGGCSEKCAVGTKQRTRTVKISKRCRGRDCPTLRETSQCGTLNNGCQHKCTNGACSCYSGYYLASNKKNCVAKDCNMPKPSYCAPGTSLGSTCRHVNVTCPGSKTTYPVTCSLGCPQYYSIKGASTVTCQTSGQWTSYASSYCRRNNDPPSQITLSGSASVPENQPRGTKIGSFSTVDPNTKDKHTYSIVSGGSGKFELRGPDLFTLTTFNYETAPNRFSLIIRSSDNGSPPMRLDETFTISVTDVNEKPTAIQLSSNTVDENTDVDTEVGALSTADPDNGQSYSYTLLDGADGRFKIQGNRVKVAKSNRNCLLNGGSQCFLNFESVSSYSIRVRSVDSGSPSQSINASFNILLNDVNDQPRGLKLSNYKVKENAPINFKIGNLSASDEDKGQKLNFSLVDDDAGRFALDSKGALYKAKSTDYETSKVHHIVAKVTDDGKPSLPMTKLFSISVLDVNEAPVSIVLSSSNINENSKPGTLVGTLMATDTDAVQNLTFKLDDDAGGRFSLQSNSSCQSINPNGTRCTTELLVSGNINYEDSSSLDVIVRVTDYKGLFRTEMFNVTVIDVNDPPTNVTLDGSVSALIPENSKGVQVDSLITEDEDQGQNFTYVLINNPGGNFQVKGDKLFTSIGAKLDYESSTSHQITVKSTDDGNPPLSVQVSLVINLQDVNEKPTNITLSNRSVQENKPAGTLIGQLTVSDPERQQSHVCSLTDSANGKVALSKNQLTVGSAGVNYEDASSLSVRVLCRDPGGLAVEDTFVILVQDVNEGPTSISLSNDKVQENQKGGTLVAQITVTDPDNEKNRVQSFTLSISSSDPNLPFQIQNNSLVTKRPLDYENSAQWLVRVTAKDDGIPSLSRTQAFTIQVIDVNDAPNGMVLSSSDVNENSDENTLVGSLTAVDQDTSQNHTFQLLNSASGRFKVDGNEIKVAISNKQCLSQGGSSCLLNYEKQKNHIIRVKTTDNGSPQLSYEKNFRIDVRDINDIPRDLQLSNNQVKEDAKISTLVGRLTSRDEDVSQSATYSLTNDDSGRFKVDSQGRLYTAKNINHETQKRHVIRAMVKDNGNPPMKMEKSFTIEVLDVNEAPSSMNITSQGSQLSFPDGHAQIRENSASGTKIGTLEAFDYDAGQNLTFNLDDDAGGKFKLGSRANCQSITNIPGVNTKCTTDLLLNGSLDYEVSTGYSLIVRVTDNKGTFRTQQLKIRVVDQNDAPENVTLGGSNAASVNENADGAFVGELVTSDQDVGQTHIYKLLDNAGGKFVISNNKVYVSSLANLDYEARSQFTIRIQSEDNGSPPLSLAKDFKITIIDVNEAPVNITLSSGNVAENSAPGTVIGQLNVTDPDNYGSRGAWQSHNCQVIGNQLGKFTVQTNLLVVGNANLDYEQAALILVQLRCSDSGSPPLSLVKVLSVSVDDVNEAPTRISLSSDVIAENQSPLFIGLFSTVDPDNANQVTNRQTFTYTLMGKTAGLPFIIDGDALNSTRSLDFEAQSSWNITIRSVDSGDPALSLIKTFQISVVDVNEKPFNISLSNAVINENSPQDALVGTVSARDSDFNQTLVYSLIDGAGGRFKLDGNKLKVALSNDDCLKIGGDFCKLNYEQQKTYKVSVRATDNGNPPRSTEAILSVTLIDVNDRPRDLKLSSNIVKENATIGTKVGQFSATDEDTSQTLQFALIDSDGGRFVVDSSGYLLKAKRTDYETNKVHKIVAQVRDSGNPPLEVNKTFTVVVENINEAPINISLTSEYGQRSFPDNIPKVNENSKRGTTVGTFHALDHDEVQSLNFSLNDDASGKFTVGARVFCHNNTYIPGVKTKCTTLLKVSGDLNYETSSSEDILVRVTDDSGLFRVQPFKVTILDVNDRPKNITLTGGDTAFIDENVNDGFVGELATIDEDINQTHSYTLINNGGWKFILRQNKIFSSFYANLDYETKSEYSIAVRSSDNGSPRLSIDKTFTVQVRDVNERPTDIILLSSSVQENSPRGTLVGKISVSDPDNNGPRGTWQNHTCKVLNIANIPFTVNETLNSLLVASDLNYEKTKSYNIDLRCRDNGKPPLSVDETVRVNVTDVNEKPYDITLSNNEVAENAGIVTVGLLDTADPDNEQTVVQTFSYKIVSPAGNIPFVIDSGALNTSKSLDYETKTTWLLEIKSTDNKGLSTSKNFTVIVRDRNDPPTGILVSGPLNVSENSVSGQYLVTVVTADQDVGQTHQYQIVDVVGHAHSNHSTSGLLNLFAVESPSGKLTLQKSGLDYEQYAKYTVTLNSTDSGFPPYSVTGSFVVSVHNINENPQNISLSNNQVLENSPVGTVIGNLSVYDPDNLNVPLQKFNCVVEDGEPFKVINHLTLVVSENSLDYETIDTYTVNVTCTELLSNPLSVSSVFFINVQDVNEAPYNLTISSQSVSENQETGYFVGMLSVLDPDLPTSGFASIYLALKDQSPGPDAFQLINSSLLTTRMLDFENQSTYTLTVVATDSGNPPLSTSLSFTIQVIDTNDRPTEVSLLSHGIYENSTAGAVVGILRAQDQDVNQSHFFTVKHTDWFAVSGSSMLLSNFSLDYETTPEINVTIEATDNGSPPYSKEDVVSIKVLDSNDRPSEITLNSSLSIPNSVSHTVVIPEYSPTGTSLTNLSVVDEDVEQQHRCMLLEGGNNFYISSLSKSSSEIRVKQGANLSYRSLRGTPLQVTVNCVDNGNPPYSIQRSFSVQVSDVNEAPFDLRFYGATVIKENVQVGYIVGNVTCKDPDIGQKHIFTVIGNYSSVFQVNNSGNQLYVINSTFLNYEALHVPTVLTVSIQATDVPVEQTGPPLYVISDVNISVVDVNEPPTDIRLIPDNISIPENVSIGYCIAQIASSNPERSQKINYTLLHHQDTFAIKDTCDDNSSVVNDAKGDLPYLTVKSHLSYNHYRIYEILIEAEDNGIPPLSFNGTVDVNVTKIDPCWSSPCQENFECKRVDWQNYTCPMINFCKSNPCQNNATCLMRLNGYQCSCVPGFTGLHCETNINDCASEPCAKGVCLDGINKFTCNCSGSGFFGTRCQRKLGVCLEESCQDQEICVPPNTLKYNSSYCKSVDKIVSLSFHEGVDTADQQWRRQLETFTETLTFPMTEVTNDKYDSTDVNVEDIYILSSKPEHSSKVKRSAPVESKTVDFVILVKSDNKLEAVPNKTVLCTINNTCNAYAMEESPDNFRNQLCESTARKVNYLGISSCVAREGEEWPISGNKYFMSKRMYYVFGASGGLLLIVLAVSLLLCRRNRQSAKKRRLFKSQRFRDNTDDETYTDAMYRHHMANQEMENVGVINPTYGMMDNPIYQEPDRKYGTPQVKRSESMTGFENPMYLRFRTGKQEEDVDDFKEEKDGATSPTGFPMFSLYRQQKTEAGVSGDAVPVKQEKQAAKNKGAPTNETPKKKKKPVNEELRVVEACGFFNPLYQTRAKVEQFTGITKNKGAPTNETPKKKKKPVNEELQVVEAYGFFNPLYQTQAKVEQFTGITKNKGTSTNETPKKKKKPVNEELQVVEACGFFNPLYQTRAQEKEFTDITSIFTPRRPQPEKKLDKELPGVTDC